MCVSPEEVISLLEELSKSKSNCGMAVLSALYTGCRRGEILKLKRKDVELKAGSITNVSSDSKNKKTKTCDLTDMLTTELLK